MVEAVTNTTSRAMVKVGPGDNNQWEKIFQCVTTLFSDPPPGLDSLKGGGGGVWWGAAKM